MKILAVLEDEKSIRVQSINGMLFVEEDWMKKKIRQKTSEIPKKNNGS